MLVCPLGIAAQTYYYNTTKTFYENGYTYQCDVEPSTLVTLYNKTNTWTYSNGAFKDGSPLDARFYNNPPRLLEVEEWTKPLCYSIVNNAFSTDEKKRTKGDELQTSLIINPETGKVMEVYFEFTTINKFATIPVSVYRKIELELKSKIWFTPTAEGKKVNRILRFWRQELEIPPNNDGGDPSKSGTKITPVKELPKMPVE